ncbi:glycosyltransferase [Variovorax sp. PCZ-1]|uniref:glycosyltransferase n=1 Tax=Variovorax sp. PCZ-1 TaxID=2835533 RepID=UPI001BD0A042|nr:glycosyltransferase [Variovorax sp. PCZ-1]MBS7808219.1 glycosyltransferase [Variovorax sp. PCZ-1]
MTQVNQSISVLLVCYNQEKYIRQALDSLFGQKFNGLIELVIADDKSTDSTLDIIKTYERLDDRFTFIFLDSDANIGITKNYKRGFATCSREYVAVLEGDDYWINPYKLQQQVEFLSLHWEADLCSVNYYIYEQESSQFTPRMPVSNSHRFISARELIADNIVGNFSTCMYRRSALARLPDALFNIKSYDWITNIVIARNSLIGFIETPMAVYRLHTAGTWTQSPHIEKLKVQLELIPAYDKLTDYVFHTEFELLSFRLKRVIATLQIKSPLSIPEIRPRVSGYFLLIGTLSFTLKNLVKKVLPLRFKNLVVQLLSLREKK